MDNNFYNDFNGNQGQYNPQQPQGQYGTPSQQSYSNQQGYGAPQQYGNAPQQPYGNPQGYSNQPQQQYGGQQYSPYSAPQGYYGQQVPPKKSNTTMIIVICAIAVVLLFGGIFVAAVIRGYKNRAEEVRQQRLTEDATEYTAEFDDDYGTDDYGSDGVVDGDDYDFPDDLTEESVVLPGELDQDSTGEIVAEFTDDIFKNAKWVEQHSNSYLVPNSDGTFTYYKDKDVQDNYYYTGHYDLYTGQAAYDYVTSNPDMASYGVTAEEMDGVFAKNEIYDMKNFVCLVLHNEQQIIDGENAITESVDTPYFGFYRVEGTGEESLDIANMNVSEYYWFSKEQ